ncbi:hypothetical protein CKAH01_16424 [Colletotrichum kahawae]|uniref:Uncharacterized protein n=1 Tax=Colletotrichum kahawae TaxID=34407 RepID=A0AAE0D8P2_COLKA|nr:hypothetical protein CKAH01_16424 [Colletotrichum kahawae]
MRNKFIAHCVTVKHGEDRDKSPSGSIPLTVALGRVAKFKQEPGERVQEFAPERAVMSAIRAKIDGFPREVRRAAGISSYDPGLEE